MGHREQDGPRREKAGRVRTGKGDGQGSGHQGRKEGRAGGGVAKQRGAVGGGPKRRPNAKGTRPINGVAKRNGGEKAVAQPRREGRRSKAESSMRNVATSINPNALHGDRP